MCWLSSLWSRIHPRLFLVASDDIYGCHIRSLHGGYSFYLWSRASVLRPTHRVTIFQLRTPQTEIFLVRVHCGIPRPRTRKRGLVYKAPEPARRRYKLYIESFRSALGNPCCLYRITHGAAAAAEVHEYICTYIPVVSCRYAGCIILMGPSAMLSRSLSQITRPGTSPREPPPTACIHSFYPADCLSIRWVWPRADGHILKSSHLRILQPSRSLRGVDSSNTTWVCLQSSPARLSCSACTSLMRDHYRALRLSLVIIVRIYHNRRLYA